MKEMTVLFLQRGSGENGEVLLAMKKRNFGAGRWNGVGGKVEPGETIEEAVVRECHEEIEVAVTGIKKAAEIVFDEMHTGTHETIRAHVFTSQTWEGEPIETEEMAPQWFSISDIPYDEMWADDPYWLPHVLAGKLVRAEFTLDEHDQVTAYDVQFVDTL